MPYSASLANLTSYTASAWVYANPFTADNGILGTRFGGDQTFDMKLMGNSLIHGDIGNGGGWLDTNADANVSLNANTWYMVTYSGSSTGYAIYLNGVQVGSGGLSSAPLSMQQGQTLGIGQCAPGELFTGLIDEVSIYNTALSASDVAAIYTGGNASVSNALSTSTPVLIAAHAILDLNGVNQKIASLSNVSGSGGTVKNSNTATASTLTLSASGGDDHLQRQHCRRQRLGTISLVMSGSGVQVLAGTNTYTGGTDVTGGTLDFAGPSATPSIGILSVEPGGYVVLGGLLGASSPTVTSEESSVESTDTTATTSTATTVTTVTTATAAATDTNSIVSGSGSIVAAGSQPAAVPEPSTVMLLLVAAAALAVAAWKRRKFVR